MEVSEEFSLLWKVLVISNFTRNIFSLEFTALQYEVLNLRGRSPHGMFQFKVWAVSVIVFGQLQFSFYIYRYCRMVGSK